MNIVVFILFLTICVGECYCKVVSESTLASICHKRKKNAFKNPESPPKVFWSEACSERDIHGKVDIPAKLFASFDKWFRTSQIDPMDRNIPYMQGSNIEVDEDTLPTLPKASSVKLLGKGHYYLTHFCIRPYIYGGLYLYGKKVSPRKSFLNVCSEFGCYPWPVTYINEPTPRKAKWINFATAFIKLFTIANPWHELQSLASMFQLIHDPNITIFNNFVHFFPAFQRDNFRRRFFPDVENPFSEEYFKLWPLLSATFPPELDMLQVNFFENIKMYNDLKDVPLICYASGYLNSPQVLTKRLHLAPGLLFGELSANAMNDFLKKSIELAGATNLNSGWCFGSKEGKRRLPLLGFILREGSRFICNIGILMKIAQKLSFEVQIIKLEGLKIEEQIRVMRQVDVLVGMHGAGLTHVVWMRKNSVMVELYPPGGPVTRFGINAYSWTNYGSLAHAAGVVHIAYAVPFMEDKNVTQWRNQNIVVDTDIFKFLLNKAHDVLKQNHLCGTNDK